MIQEILIRPDGTIHMLICDPDEYVENGKVISPLYERIKEELRADGIEVEEIYLGICG